MSFGKAMVLVPAVGLVALLAVLPAAPEKPGADSEVYEVRLADGSVVKMRLLTEELEISTRYGDLKVPVADVRRIDIGFRYPEGVEKRVAEAVARLGAADFKAREAAGAELLRLKELAYPALKRAVKSADQEVKRRATELVREIEDRVPAERLRLRDQDVVYTSQFPIAGRIKAPSLKGQSPVFGEVQVQFADARQVRSLAGTGEYELTLDAAHYAAVSQDQWLETEVEVEKGAPLKIRAGGLINLNPQNGNHFQAGPDGNAQWGQNGGFAPGMLIGRIGRNGQQFMVRSHYDGEAPQSGRLFLRIGPSPWGQQAVGSYAVKVSTEAGLGGVMNQSNEAPKPPAPAVARPARRLILEKQKAP